MLKAIETTYKGDLFRSRLEAKWAIVFDQLGIEYRYEIEGYDLGDTRYLPDFWLPDAETWVEIKPQKPSDDELRKARELHQCSGKDVVILYGDAMDFSRIGAVVFPESRTGEGTPARVAARFVKWLAYCQLRKSARQLLTHLDCLETYPQTTPNDFTGLCSSNVVMFQVPPSRAFEAARQSRFEHRNGHIK